MDGMDGEGTSQMDVTARLESLELVWLERLEGTWFDTGPLTLSTAHGGRDRDCGCQAW